MLALAPKHSPVAFVAARLPRWLTWLLVLACAVSLAGWTWRLLPLPRASAPGPLATPAAVPSAARLSAQHWFGAASVTAGAPSGRYVLRWVYPGRPGVCILGVAGLRDRAFRVGEEVEPGLVVREVGADSVLLAGPAGSERLPLSNDKARRGQTAATAVTEAARAIGVPPRTVPHDH